MEFTPGERNVKIKLPDGGPLKFQVTRVKLNSIDQWKTMELEISDEDAKQWEVFEDTAKPYGELPWSSKLSGTNLRVKIDDRTMFFDSKSELTCSVPTPGSTVSCIIEIKSVYNFKGQSGLTTRAHQIKNYGSGWLGSS